MDEVRIASSYEGGSSIGRMAATTGVASVTEGPTATAVYDGGGGGMPAGRTRTTPSRLMSPDASSIPPDEPVRRLLLAAATAASMSIVDPFPVPELRAAYNSSALLQLRRLSFWRAL